MSSSHAALATYRKRPFADLDGLTVLLVAVIGLLEVVMIYLGSQVELPQLSQQDIHELFAARYQMLKVEAPPAAPPADAGALTAEGETGEAEEAAEEAPAEEDAGAALERPAERQQGSAQMAEARRSAAAERRASRRAAISQQLINSTGGISLVTGSGGGAAARGLVDAAQVTGGGAVSTQGLAGMVTGRAAENVRRLKTGGATGGGAGSGGVNLQGALTDVDTRAGGGGTVGALFEGAVQTFDRSGKFAGQQARSREALQSAMDGYQPGLKDCFDRQLQRDNTLKGSLLFTVTIRADGSVGDVELSQQKWSDASLGRRVESCLKQKMGGWRFDPVDPALGDFRASRKLAFGG